MFREAPPTEKQLDFIHTIEECGAPEFTGTTKKDASTYISKYRELADKAADDIRNADPWMITHGYV